MELDFLWLIVSALLGCYVFIFWFLKRVNEWYYVGMVRKSTYRLPPGDMGWPFLGNMLPLFKSIRSADANSFIYNLVSRYGNTGIYKTHMFGCPSIIVCRPEICRRVLTNDEHFTLGYPKSTNLLGGRISLHSVSNEEHKRLRRLIASPINGHEALTMYIQHTEDIAIDSFDEWASMKQPFEFYTEIKKATFKIMTHIFMGSVSDSTLWTTHNLYADYRKGLMSMAINIPGFAFHKALKARKKMVKVLQSILDKKREMTQSKQHQGTKDMMDLLSEAEDEDGRKLEDEDIVDLILLFLSAGFDSSAVSILWAIIHLTENPEALRKAKEEQEGIIKRRPSNQIGLKLKEIKQMEYLAKVIDETLRMTNIFSLFRKAKADVSINDYIIPEGWKVLVWYGAVHMDPEIYDNPQNFNPSRWDNLKAKGKAFIPFGAGNRSCPGSDLAKLVISIFLHHFLLNYKLKRVNPKSPLSYIQGPMPKDLCLAQVIRIP
ncbi:hypothetical protein ACB098_03G064600 [Castanea mollissima]